jgi:site-specific recombinase XerD
LLSILFNHACRYEFFDRNPIRLVRQGAKRRGAPSVLAPAEIKALLSSLALRERTLVLLAASTGLRQSELFGVKVGRHRFCPTHDQRHSLRCVRRCGALQDRVLPETRASSSVCF